MTHWAIALYERYVQLFGEPIEQPIDPRLPVNESASGAPRDDSPSSRGS